LRLLLVRWLAVAQAQRNNRAQAPVRAGYNRGSRWGGVLRGIFVAVVYGILLFFATIALIFPAILLR
jgi:hypothetical protein